MIITKSGVLSSMGLHFGDPRSSGLKNDGSETHLELEASVPWTVGIGGQMGSREGSY